MTEYGSNTGSPPSVPSGAGGLQAVAGAGSYLGAERIPEKRLLCVTSPCVRQEARERKKPEPGLGISRTHYNV
ncbi:hypothetical protein XELAEV_18011724mg [Xenopus laevis]|uniref:Uncharacterized protein n=1 Tax=Xenopus laevis TaxID=8355 RepID=A0A974DN55_XENLA|nr:hypothetical protein XELAEV_18011724mg [Xenopus laevis]